MTLFARCMLAGLAITLASCGKQRTDYVAWRCLAEKDVMALRIGSNPSPYESISFDGGGMALHLRGRRSFAPDYIDLDISLEGKETLQIHLLKTGEIIQVAGVEQRCIAWLRTNHKL